MHLGLNFERSLTYALHVHGGHVRKGTDVPYFSHLMAVSATVIENGGSEDEAIAALLHDAVEDQGGQPRLNDIRDRFGNDVAEIVEACSDSLDGATGGPQKNWLERKRGYLRDLPTKSAAILRVSVADKLHNTRAIYRDATSGGKPFWERFSRPRETNTVERTIAYYSALYSILREVHPTPVTAELGVAVAALHTLIEDEDAHDRIVKQLLPEQAG